MEEAANVIMQMVLAFSSAVYRLLRIATEGRWIITMGFECGKESLDLVEPYGDDNEQVASGY